MTPAKAIPAAFVVFLALAAAATAFSWNAVTPAEKCPGSFSVTPVIPVIKATPYLETLKAGDIPYDYGYLCDKNKATFPQIKITWDSCAAYDKSSSLKVTVNTEQKTPVKNIYPRQAKGFGTGAGWSTDPQKPNSNEESERLLSEKGVAYEITDSNEYKNEVTIGGVVEKKGGEYCISPLEPGEYEIWIDATKKYQTTEPDSYLAIEGQTASLTFGIDEGNLTVSQVTYGKKSVLYEYDYGYAGMEAHSLLFSVYSASVEDLLLTIKTASQSMDILPEIIGGTVMLTITQPPKEEAKIQLTQAGQVFSTESTFLNNAKLSANVVQILPDVARQLVSADLQITLSHPLLQRAVTTAKSIFGTAVPVQQAQAEEIEANKNRGRQAAGSALPQVTAEQYVADKPEPCKSCLNAKCIGTTIRLFKSIEQCTALWCTEECG